MPAIPEQVNSENGFNVSTILDSFLFSKSTPIWSLSVPPNTRAKPRQHPRCRKPYDTWTSENGMIYVRLRRHWRQRHGQRDCARITPRALGAFDVPPDITAEWRQRPRCRRKKSGSSGASRMYIPYVLRHMYQPTLSLSNHNIFYYFDDSTVGIIRTSRYQGRIEATSTMPNNAEERDEMLILNSFSMI